MGRFTRRQDIDRRRRRQSKIKKLKAKLVKAKSTSETQALVTKIQLVSPNYPLQAAK